MSGSGNWDGSFLSPSLHQKPILNALLKPADRARVETEQDPKALFHELMQVSQDGTVPEHLMARLRDAEERVDSERRQKLNAPSPLTQDSPSQTAVPTRSTGKGKNTRPQRRDVVPGSEEDSLYVAFGQMFLEEQDDETE